MTEETCTKEFTKYPQENIQNIKLSHDLLKHQSFFEEVLNYVGTEKRALIEIIEQLTEGILNESLYKEARDRLGKVCEEVNQPTVHGNIKLFIFHAFNLERTIWKEADYSSRLFKDIKVKYIREKFDWIIMLFDNCEDLLSIELERIKFMDESLKIDESKANWFINEFNNYELKSKEKKSKIIEMFDVMTDSKYKSIKGHLSHTKIYFDPLFYNFVHYCNTDYHTAVVKQYSDLINHPE